MRTFLYVIMVAMTMMTSAASASPCNRGDTKVALQMVGGPTHVVCVPPAMLSELRERLAGLAAHKPRCLGQMPVDSLIGRPGYICSTQLYEEARRLGLLVR